MRLAGIVARFLSAFFPVFLFFRFGRFLVQGPKKIAGMASADLMRCGFLLCVGGSRLRFAVAALRLVARRSATGELMRCDFLLCVGGSRLRFNRKRKPLFLPGILDQFFRSTRSRLMRRIDRLTVTFQVGKPAGFFGARTAELGLSPKSAGSGSELIRQWRQAIRRGTARFC